MKIRINKYGLLSILRGKERNFIKQSCPYDNSDNRGNCGDWCPLFGDPYQNDLTLKYQMDICKKTFIFSDLKDIIDEREE
jgi:hypothetical protein